MRRLDEARPGQRPRSGTDTPTDKGGPSASYIVAIERAKTNNGTLWAGTRRGRIWVTKNADSTNAAAVVQEPDCCGTGFNERQSDVEFKRIDTPLQPRRFPSGISVDPRDPTGNTAYISFSGYEAYSPGQPGHVFKAVYNPATGTATWTDLSGTSATCRSRTSSSTLRPVTSTPRTTGASSGSRPARTNWVDADRGLPEVAIYELSQANIPGTSKRVIYAATHGRGGYRLILGRGHHGGGDDDD